MMVDTIEQELEKLIPPSSPFFASLFQGARYSLLAPGKRIRPELTLLSVDMLDPQSIQKAIHPALALEVVHCYSLIHDDLPCMDNDDIRRGQPTLHKVYNEGHAVLVGDYLLTLGFEILAKAPGLNSDQKIKLIQTLAHASGSEGIIGGQIMDIEKHQNIKQLHLRKTASLFRAALAFSGIITKVSFQIQKQLETFGQLLGELFQMVDDIVDKDHPLGEKKALQAANNLKKEALFVLRELPFDTILLEKMVHRLSSDI